MQRAVDQHDDPIRRRRAHAEPDARQLLDPLGAAQPGGGELEPLVVAHELLALGGEAREAVALLHHPRAHPDLEQSGGGEQRAGEGGGADLAGAADGASAARLLALAAAAHASLSTARRRALRERGFSRRSPSLAWAALRVRGLPFAPRPAAQTRSRGGATQPGASRGKPFLPTRSSTEGK